MYDARSLSFPLPPEILAPEVCVIGGGPAGITVALELGARGHQVLLLESGGLQLEAASTALNEGEVTGYPLRGGMGTPQRLDQVRFRWFGGGTNVWAGFSRPLLAEDLADQPHQPLGGWPIPVSELDAHYPTAHDYGRLGPFNYDVDYWAAQTGFAVPPIVGDLEPKIVQLQPTRYAGEHLARLDAPPITVVHHATVTQLRPSVRLPRVQSAVVQAPGGIQFLVKASTFVVATGGLEVPRLLLASDAYFGGGIGNEHDLVGRYFADHLAGSFAFLLLTPPPEDFALINSPGHVVDTHCPDGSPTSIEISGALDLSQAARAELGIPGLHLEVRSQHPNELPTQIAGIGAAQAMELLQASPTGGPQTLMLARTFLESVPNAASRVTLTDARDSLGMRRLRFDWHPTSTDDANRRAGMRHVAEKVAATGLGMLQDGLGVTTLNGSTTATTTAGFLALDPRDPDRPVIHETTYHHMCTTRMATDPTEGVVDTDCRVHSMENLYIAGSSVFPTPVGFYPTLTIVALAARLAAHLHAVLP